MSDDTTTVAVYGTLRHGHGLNYGVFRGRRPITTARIPGRLWSNSNGSFPYAVVDPDTDETFVIELYEASSQELGQIRQVELGAGYTEEAIEFDDGTVALIYTRPQADASPPGPRVDTGDWADFVRERASRVHRMATR